MANRYNPAEKTCRLAARFSAHRTRERGCCCRSLYLFFLFFSLLFFFATARRSLFLSQLSSPSLSLECRHLPSIRSQGRAQREKDGERGCIRECTIAIDVVKWYPSCGVARLFLAEVEKECSSGFSVVGGRGEWLYLYR